MSKRGESLAQLVELMQTLLGPNGCPWDREQTLESLRQYVIEEAHEVVDAIDGGNPEMLREELGDLLLQVVFQASLTEQRGWFDIDGVVDAISEKLVRTTRGCSATKKSTTRAERSTAGKQSKRKRRKNEAR